MSEKTLGRLIGDLISEGRYGGGRAGADARTGKRKIRQVAYDAHARDADGDGIVQEGTNEARRVDKDAEKAQADAGKARTDVGKIKKRVINGRHKPEEVAKAHQVLADEHQALADAHRVEAEKAKRRVVAGPKPKKDVAEAEKPVEDIKKPTVLKRRDNPERAHRPNVPHKRVIVRQKLKPEEDKPKVPAHIKRRGKPIADIENADSHRNKDGVLIKNGVPKIEGFTPGDFGGAIPDVEPHRRVNQQNFQIVKNDWDSVEGIKAHESGLLARIGRRERTGRAFQDELKNADKRGNHFEVARLQKRIARNEDDIHQLQDHVDFIKRRRVVLENRDLAKKYIIGAENESNDLTDREGQLRVARAIVDDINHGPDASHAEIGKGALEFNADVNRRIVAADESIGFHRQDVHLPQEVSDMAKLGGFEQRQKNIDELRDKVDVQEPKTEDIKKVQEEVAKLQEERNALGDRVKSDTEKTINHRRWLDANITQLKASTQKRGARLDIYPLPNADRASVLAPSDPNGLPPPLKNGKKITNETEAIEHVKNGGSLGDVDGTLWKKVLEGNSSRTGVDQNTRFLHVQDPNRGAIGDTQIYVVRNENGQPGTTGYVLKAAKDSDNIAEVMGQHLMVQHGLPVEGAAWDGKNLDNKDFVVLPFVGNAVEDGKLERPDGRNYQPKFFNDIEDRGRPQRLHAMMHNYLLSVDDRHANNGITARVGQQAYAFPIDQGWAGQAGMQALDSYNYGMDYELFDETFESLEKSNSEKEAKAIVHVYDEMTRRANEISKDGMESMKNNLSQGKNLSDSQRRNIQFIFDLYQRKAERLSAERQSNLSRLIPPALLGKVLQ